MEPLPQLNICIYIYVCVFKFMSVVNVSVKFKQVNMSTVYCSWIQIMLYQSSDINYRYIIDFKRRNKILVQKYLGFYMKKIDTGKCCASKKFQKIKIESIFFIREKGYAHKLLFSNENLPLYSQKKAQQMQSFHCVFDVALSWQ